MNIFESISNFLQSTSVTIPIPYELIRWTWARKLQMVLLKHKPTGLRVRFYCTHFTPYSENKWQRRSQARRLIEEVKKWTSRDDELPPILVGDFNAKRVYGEGAEDCIDILEKDFCRPLDDVRVQHNIKETLIDHVWIGKEDSFSHITHYFKTVSLQRVLMRQLEKDAGRKYMQLTDDGIVPSLAEDGFPPVPADGFPWLPADGFPKTPLTDHKFCEGFLLRIEPISKELRGQTTKETDFPGREKPA